MECASSTTWAGGTGRGWDERERETGCLVDVDRREVVTASKCYWRRWWGRQAGEANERGCTQDPAQQKRRQAGLRGVEDVTGERAEEWREGKGAESFFEKCVSLVAAPMHYAGTRATASYSRALKQR